MFKENFIITGKIVCKTGLHIGGSNDGINIGGSDNVVIRDAIDNLPYIPGSSLKGKLRSILELSDKQSAISVINNEGNVANDETCKAVQIFGRSAEKDEKDEKEKNLKFPTRIIVRDAFPDRDTENLWDSHESILDGTELKYENTIDRITSHANPRNIERVPVGSKFNFEIIFSMYENDDITNLLTLLNTIKLMKDSYLGGNGSRGYGQVDFEEISVSKRNKEYYIENNADEKIINNKTIEEACDLLKNYIDKNY